MMLPFLVALVPCLPPPQDAASQRFAEINGQVIERAEFADWLVDTHGFRYAEDFTVLILFRQEAARLGIAVGPDDLEQAFERHWADQVLLRYGGDEGVFLEELGKSGIDRESYRRRHWANLETQELGRRIVLKTRAPSEEDLEEMYHVMFPGNRRLHLQVAFFDRFKGFQEQRSPSEPVLQELDAVAKRRAEAFFAAVKEKPGDFAALARDTSDLLRVTRFDMYLRDLRDSDSDLPYYNPTQFRGALEPLLAKTATSGELLEPYQAQSGCYVVRVVENESVKYEDVEQEVHEYFLGLTPTAREIYGLRLKLLEQARIDPPLHTQR